MYNVLRLLEGLPALLFIIFLIIFNSVAAAKKKNNSGAEARKAHIASINNEYKQIKATRGSTIETLIAENPDAVVDRRLAYKMARLNKQTEEKTHSHVGELRIEGTGLMEDRQNDWLAKQIREETRLSRRLM